jgi:hypothetical protein
MTPTVRHGRQHGEALPEFAVEPGPLDLVNARRASAARKMSARSRVIVADDAHGQARSGERLAPRRSLGGSPSSSPTVTDLVLEERRAAARRARSAEIVG